MEHRILAPILFLSLACGCSKSNEKPDVEKVLNLVPGFNRKPKPILDLRKLSGAYMAEAPGGQGFNLAFYFHDGFVETASEYGNLFNTCRYPRPMRDISNNRLYIEAIDSCPALTLETTEQETNSNISEYFKIKRNEELNVCDPECPSEILFVSYVDDYVPWFMYSWPSERLETLPSRLKELQITGPSESELEAIHQGFRQRLTNTEITLSKTLIDALNASETTKAIIQEGSIIEDSEITNANCVVRFTPKASEAITRKLAKVITGHPNRQAGQWYLDFIHAPPGGPAREVSLSTTLPSNYADFYFYDENPTDQQKEEEAQDFDIECRDGVQNASLSIDTILSTLGDLVRFSQITAP